MALTGGGVADLIARAVVAAAQVYGDDPAVAMTTKSPPLRRALSAAAAAMAERLGLTTIDAARLVGCSAATVEGKVRYGDATWRAARNAAIAAIGGSLPFRREGTPMPGDGGFSPEGAQLVAADPHPGPADRPSPQVGGLPAARPHMAGPCGRMEGPLPDAPAMVPLSPNRASRTVGKPAPRKVDAREVEIGRSPADQVGDRYERTFVLERRGRNVPWHHIATQLGARKTADDLRRIYDPSFERAAIVAVVDAGRVAAAMAPVARDHRGEPGAAVLRERCPSVEPGSMEHRALALIDDGVTLLASRLGRTPKQTANLVYVLRCKGLTVGVAGGLRLTDAGKAQLEALRAR